MSVCPRDPPPPPAALAGSTEAGGIVWSKVRALHSFGRLKSLSNWSQLAAEILSSKGYWESSTPISWESTFHITHVQKAAQQIWVPT